MNELSSIGSSDLRAREALRFVAANTLQSVVAGAIGAGVLVFLLRHSIQPWPATLWLLSLFVAGALRLLLRARLLTTGEIDTATTNKYLFHFMSYALVSGLVWAAAPWALGNPGNRTLQSVVLLACAAIGTGGAFASLASLRTAFAIFWPPTVAIILFGLLDGGGYYLSISGATLVLSLVLMRLLLVLNQQFNEQVELRVRNAELLAALQQRTADAEAANEAKSRFMVAASHDLRQPMHAIAIRSRALLELALPVDVRDVAQRLDQSIEALQSLFDALLDISKLDTGAVQPQVSAISLKTLFARLALGYADVAKEQRVDLAVDTTELWVNSDPIMLERILRQLLDNAMRHAANSKVSLQARSSGEQIIIEVCDTGKGIPQQQQRDIFKEFVQLENPERDRRKGLGLGLTIVERLARQLGHPLALESTPGQGTVFRILVGSAAAQVPTVPAEIQPPPTAPAPIRNLYIGLLDDDPDVLDAMQLLLTRWQCDVVAATHSQQLADALKLEGRTPDLLICDYRLAEKRNGLDVIDELRNIYGNSVPALLISGDVRAIEGVGDAKGIIVLRKPVPSEVLREMIAKSTGRSPAR